MGKSLSFERRQERRDGECFQKNKHVPGPCSEITPGCSKDTEETGSALTTLGQEPRGGRRPGRAPGGGRGLDAAWFAFFKGPFRLLSGSRKISCPRSLAGTPFSPSMFRGLSSEQAEM